MVLQKDEKAVLDETMQVTKWWNRFNMRGGDGAHAMPSSGEEMGDMIAGDQKIIHHHYPPPAPAKWGKVAKLALAGGLLATGFGASLAIPLAISALKPTAPAVQPIPVPATDTDSDTSTELNFWDK